MTVEVISRDVWGARRPNGDKNLSGAAAGVFVHHSVTTHLPENATVEQECAEMRKLESIGYSRFGAFGQGISYNLVVFPSGRAYEGVSMHRRGAHTDGRNSVVRSICFAGNYQANQPSAAAVETAAQLLARGKHAGWWTGLILGGHRDIKATSCPGDRVYLLPLEAMNARARALLGGAAPVGNPVVPAPSTSTRSSYRAPGQYVQRGDYGPGVGEAQRELARLGFYRGDLDDAAGPQTETAIRALQLAAGIARDGVWGDESRAAAAGVPDYPGLTVLGTRRTGRTEPYQQRLADRGWRITVDDWHGAGTDRVLRAFQAEKGLTVDGDGGPQTWTALWTRPL